jgi:succinyl-CoA synthetase alpha subunit
MSVQVLVRKNTYFDSVSLMSLSTQANRIEGVAQAVVAMATAMNKGVLRDVGLYTAAMDDAGSGDLVIAVRVEAGVDADGALAAVEALLQKGSAPARTGEVRFATLEGALKQAADSNLAIVSVPGEFAAREARRALEAGLHVLLFSDNVAVDDEVALKNLAHDRGLLLMGPDCGTAILGHVGLCFANAVRRGSIGIVAASGTGSQEVSVRIHALGGGISQLIGTGGRDLSERVGGIMMIDGLRALARDPETEVIVLVSKPPAKAVEAKVLAEIAHCGKPVVVCFLDGSEASVRQAGGHFARTTSGAALRAAALAGLPRACGVDPFAIDADAVRQARERLAPGQQYVRALMCGGTLCDEVMFLVREKTPEVYSNIAKDPEHQLQDVDTSRAHTFIDFGDDAFTRGRPHPMIDPSLRIERLLREARDPSVAVIVLDFVLGWGAHEDPAGVTVPAIEEAREIAAREGRHLEFVGYVLGTEEDQPSLAAQVRKLTTAGVTLAGSCTQAALIARSIVEKGLQP